MVQQIGRFTDGFVAVVMARCQCHFDGFFASAQFGILFPLNGLRYLEVDGVREPGTEGLGISRAMTLRLILGIEF